MVRNADLLPDHPDCLNCGSELRGQYCGNCGQRARGRLISLWELLQDAFGDLFEIDSRLWRTMIPLLIRPGRLTLDYLEGRRARYMPPFRMYLVLSLIFFVVAFFDPQDDLGLLFEPDPAPEEIVGEREEIEAAANEVLSELADEGIISTEEAANLDDGLNVRFGVTDDAESEGLDFNINPESDKCTVSGWERLPEWLKRRLTKERLETTCDRIRADNGKTLGKLVLDNIPIALIVLLPVMALVLKALYPLSRRYFVEHLLFFVHFHAFFFLILTLQILFSRIAGFVHLPEPVAILVVAIASLYIPVYLYKAMRLVYGQGHFFTLTKYVVLATAYSIGATFTILGALMFALFAI